MAEIVGGFIIPHAPLLCAAPEAPSKQQREACWQGFRAVVDRMRAWNVDTVIIIGDDHYTIMSPRCIPPILIGIGDVEGPIEPWVHAPRTRIENNEALAQHIMTYGHQHGVDWAFAKTLVVDHSIYVPYHYAVRPIPNLKTIPIYVNAGIEPLIPSHRCYEVGQAIARAIESWPHPSRVAIFGTGGFAHWPGMANMAELNAPWDREILKLLEAGNAKALIDMSDETTFASGGNGAWEMKNWICLMGALGRCTGEVIAYEPVYEWIASCGYIEMKRAA